MILPNKVYSYLKWVLAIVVPATITLLVKLGGVWDFDPMKAVETISAIATFLGVIFGISCYQYNQPAEVDVTGLQYIEDEDEEDLEEIEGVEADE